MEFIIYSKCDGALGYVKIDGNRGTINWYELATWWGDLQLDPRGSDEFSLYEDAEHYQENDLLQEICSSLKLADDYMYL